MGNGSNRKIIQGPPSARKQTLRFKHSMKDKLRSDVANTPDEIRDGSKQSK